MLGSLCGCGETSPGLGTASGSAMSAPSESDISSPDSSSPRSPGKSGMPSALTSTYFLGPRFLCKSHRRSPRYLLMSSAPKLSSLVAARSCSLAQRQREPRIFTQQPPAVGIMTRPGPIHLPGPTRGCLQTKTNCPSVKVVTVRCRALRDRCILVRLSRADHARVAATRISSDRWKSAEGFSLRSAGSMASSLNTELGNL